MSSKSLRINPSSSPRGSAEHARPGKNEVARSPAGTKSPKIMANTTSKPPRGESRFKFGNVSQEQPNYIHVHHYKNSSLYGAWFMRVLITTDDPSKAGKKKRLFFGSHLTAYLAARAQDRAALKYKPSALDPSSIQLNFKKEHYAADEELRRILTNHEFGELLRKESRQKYTKMEPTPCLRKFLEEEAAAGNIPVQSFKSDNKGLTLKQYLHDVMQKRNMRPGLLNERSDDGSEDEEPDEETEDEVEVPVDINEARNAKRMEREMARIALTPPTTPVQTERTRRFPLRSGSKRIPSRTQPASPVGPASPVQTERTRRFPLRSGSKRIPSRIDQEEPPVLKWGSKRRRSNTTKRSSAPWSNATKMFLADRTETEFVTGSKLQDKLHRLNTKSKTPEASASTTLVTMASAPGVDLQPIDTFNLDLLASTAVALLMLEDQERQ